MSFLNRLRKLLGKPTKKSRNTRSRYPTFESKKGERRAAGAKPSKPKRSTKKWAIYKRGKAWLKRLLLIGGVLAVLLFTWCYLTLPNIDDLNKFSKAPSILIKSENGQIVGSFGDIYGDYIPFKEMPASLVDAVVATEDRNFYHHFGIDPFGILRAGFADLRAHHMVQGGSTITQQVAKNVFLTPERSMTRKIKEMILAIKLERRFSKQDIMSIYLNRVYLGAGSYGIDAAAHRYFEKSARELNLSESAVMAGLLKAPSKYSPASNPGLSKKRAEQVLLNMKDAGYLTQNQTDHALLALDSTMSKRKKTAQSSLYFADWIMDQLPEYTGTVQQDLVVTTTLNPDWQLLGEKAINDIMDKSGDKLDASQAALLSMTPDGAIRVMIGGRSYAESQFNRVTQALRQPGSSFKLFVYLAGLESGMTPDTIVNDHPISVPIWHGVWEPKNYTNKYLGEIPLREAVANSINTVAVQVSQEAGLGHVIDVARRLGITSDLEAVPSIALGSTEVSLLEMTGAYAHLPAEGQIVYPYGIVKIDTAEGETIYTREPQPSGAVLRASVVAEMNEMLIGVIDHGTGKAASIGRPAAGKTGTTSDYRDAWFMGYTPDLVTGVWVGNDDNTPMKKVTGGTLPAQIWHGFMQAALSSVPAHSLNTHSESAPLPWNPESNNDQTLPQTPDNSGPAPGPHPPRRDVNLDKSFWDKLLR